jgi:hypothetical protein
VDLSSGDAVNNFQILTMWIVGIAVGVGSVWLLMWAGNHLWCRISPTLAGVCSYRINGPFVEICVADGYSLTDLRALFESIRDDPTLPSEPLLLFDGSARTEVLTDADVRARLAALLDILRPRMKPVFAVIVSSAITLSAEAAQRYAAAAGIRVELFLDFERARRWLSTCAPISERS